MCVRTKQGMEWYKLRRMRMRRCRTLRADWPVLIAGFNIFLNVCNDLIVLQDFRLELTEKIPEIRRWKFSNISKGTLEPFDGSHGVAGTLEKQLNILTD